MGLFDKFRRKKDEDVIDLAMNNLKRNGVRKEDTLEYAIDKGITTHKNPLTDEERKMLKKTEIGRGTRATQNELYRIYLDKTKSKTKAAILSDWAVNKDRGATYFTIYCPSNPKYDGQKFPIDDIDLYLEFLDENNGSVDFHRDSNTQFKVKIVR